MQEVIRRTKGAELPDIGITWYQEDGATLYNFSAGWTFAVRIGNPGQTALVTPTATGAATAPNIVVVLATAALDSIAEGTYHMDVTPRFTALVKDLDTRTWLFQVRNGVRGVTATRTRYLQTTEHLSPTNIDNSFGGVNVSKALTDWLASPAFDDGDLFRLRPGFYNIPQGIRIGRPCRLDLNGSILLMPVTDGSEYVPLWDDWDEDATWPLKRVAVLVAASNVTITNSAASTARIIGAARTVNFTGGFTELPRGCTWSAALEGQHAIRLGGATSTIDRTFIDLTNISLEFCHGDGIYLNDNTTNTTIIGTNLGEAIVGGTVALVSGIWYQVGATGATVSGTDWVLGGTFYPGIHHMGRHGIATDFTIDRLTVRGVSIWQMRRAIIDLEPSGIGDTQTNIELDHLETGAKELLWLAAAGPRSISNLWVHDCVSYDWLSIDTVNGSATARHANWLLENNRGQGIRHGDAWELDRVDGLQILNNYQAVNAVDGGIDPGDSTSITITPAEGVQFPKGAPARLASAAGVANPVTKGP